MRIIFLGTPDFAVAALAALVENGYHVVAVVTATDKMGGRGNKQCIESDVKRYAVSKGLLVLQPEKLRDPAFLAQLKALQADLQIVVAFRMLPEVVWNMPPLGTFNLHASLLPQYRGAAPINWAIINGEKETGVTTFFLKHEIDTGDLLFQQPVPITDEDTLGTLYDRLKTIGAALVLKTIRAILANDYKPLPQDTTKVSHAPKIFLDTCQINFNQTTQKVYDFIRGLSPYPTAWMLWEGEMMKVFAAKKEHSPPTHACGEVVIERAKKTLKVATTDGYIHLLDVQPARRKRMDALSFMNGLNDSH